MTEKEYTIRLRSLVKCIEYHARQLYAGVISQQDFGHYYMHYKNQLARLKKEYSDSKEKELENY
mgnify:CR=1 FL=1